MGKLGVVVVACMLAGTIARADNVQAKLAYGQTLTSKGELTRARSFYVELQKRVSGDAKVVIADRIAAIDKLTCPAPTFTTADGDRDGAAIYTKALAALQAGDVSLAQALAMRSATAGGPRATDAKILYGDTLFMRGELQRAKRFYIGLRTTTTGTTATTLVKKIAAANQALQLPDSDGL